MNGTPDPRPAPDNTPRERKREQLNQRDWDDSRYCVHDGASLEPMPDDPLLPGHITPLECPECGEVYHLNAETGEMEIDA